MTASVYLETLHGLDITGNIISCVDMNTSSHKTKCWTFCDPCVWITAARPTNRQRGWRVFPRSLLNSLLNGFRNCSYVLSAKTCNKISNYIFICHLALGFNILRKDNCKPRRETFKFWELVSLILENLRYFWVLKWDWLRHTQTFDCISLYQTSEEFPDQWFILINSTVVIL